MDFNIILYIVFGVLPSLVWLFYYLRKDVHPESNGMIIKIFFWGAIITLPVFFIQIGLKEVLNIFSLNLGLPSIDNLLGLSFLHLNLLSLIFVLIYWFIVISFSEEIFKYLVIKFKVINSPHLDEPVDIMVYMVIAALGFTAIENVLYIFAPAGQFSFNDLITRTLFLSFIRFIGATFLHTLCSAVIGYFLALSICQAKNKKLYFSSGLFFATALHGFYNFSIIALEGNLKIIIPITILITLAILTSLGFEKLKELKSVCIINKS